MYRTVQALVLSAALVLGASAVASAATLNGKITKIDAATKTFVVTAGKKSIRFSMASDGKVTKNDEPKTLADLKVKDGVKVDYTMSGKKHVASRVEITGSGESSAAAPTSRSKAPAAPK
jgi:hypothetical protein